jgi:hypothetical protein
MDVLEKELDEAMNGLRKEFEEAMREIDAKGKLFDSTLTAMTDMLGEHSGVETARILIMELYDSTGLEKLAKKGGLKFSVEWLVARTPKFHRLFEDKRIIEKAEESIAFWQNEYPNQKDEPPKHRR